MEKDIKTQERKLFIDKVDVSEYLAVSGITHVKGEPPMVNFIVKTKIGALLLRATNKVVATFENNHTREIEFESLSSFPHFGSEVASMDAVVTKMTTTIVEEWQ